MKEPPKTVVPASAVADRGGAKVVFVIDQGKVRMTAVELGETFGEGYVLLKGPAPGTRVVKNPDAKLADGQKIKEKTE
jgi:adenine/guanine phosphoribosyltransferase-like PRPP-binding protein